MGYQNMKILAVIPARKGSKRLPNKNIRKIAGKPMIIYTFETARQSKYIDDIVLSTDCEKTKYLAEAYGIKTLDRSLELATDEAMVEDVVFEVLDILAENYDLIVLLQPTSPLREAQDIDNAIEILHPRFKEKSAVVGLATTAYCEQSLVEMDPITQCITLMPSSRMIYKPNGAIYVIRLPVLIQERTFYPSKTLGYWMSRERSIDIDTEFDLELATFLVRRRESDTALFNLAGKDE